MAAIVGATELTSTTEAMIVMRPRLVARPASARPMGTPMATIEPKATSSTMTATAMPMSSWPPNCGCTASDGSSPPSSTVTAPPSVTDVATASRRSKAASRMSAEGWSYCTST